MDLRGSGSFSALKEARTALVHLLVKTQLELEVDPQLCQWGAASKGARLEED